MLSEMFYYLFNMSVVGGLMGVFVFLLRCTKRIPPKVMQILWLIPFLRFILPFGLSGKYSLMSLISKYAAKTVVVYEVREEVRLSYMNMMQSAKSYFPVEYKTNVLEKLFDFSSVVWLCGFAVLTFVLLFVYFTTKKELSDSRWYKDNIYFSHKVTSPAVYGIFAPKIILPEEMRGKISEYVLMHERAHIKSLDNLKRTVAYITVFVHWFNPLSWLFLKCFLEDLELSCDEKVIMHFDGEQKREYAKTLLEHKERVVYVSSFGGAKIKTRIENILSYKRMSAFSTVMFSVLCAVMFYLLLTNA